MGEWGTISRFGEECNYGEIYVGKLGKVCNFVLKYLSYENSNTDEMIDNEIKMQNECAKFGLCLPLIDFYFSETGGTLVTRKLDYTIANLFLQYKSLAIRNLILSNVLLLIERLHSKGFYHGDLHLNNIMVKAKEVQKTVEDENELEFYMSQNYTYYFIDFGKAGKMEDEYCYKDYSEVYDHLYELCEEDTSLKTIIQIMKISMDNLVVDFFLIKNIDENMCVKYNDEECILKDILLKVVPGDIIEIDFVYFNSLLFKLKELHQKSYSFSTDKRYGKWRFIIFGEN